MLRAGSGTKSSVWLDCDRALHWFWQRSSQVKKNLEVLDEGVIVTPVGEVARIKCTRDYSYGSMEFPAWAAIYHQHQLPIIAATWMSLLVVWFNQIGHMVSLTGMPLPISKIHLWLLHNSFLYGRAGMLDWHKMKDRQ